MKKKHLYIILALLALAILVYAPTLIRDRGPGEPPPEGEGLTFPALARGTPVEVRVAGPPERDTIRLRRTPDRWTVNGHPADSAKVADLLAALDTMRAQQLVARNPENHARLGVDDAGGRRVDVATREGPAVTFYLGERDLAAGGYYIRRAEADEVYLLPGPVGGYLGRDVEGWRDRRIAAVDTAAAKEIVLERDGEATALIRGSEGWYVNDLAADSATVASLLRALADLTATGFPSDSAIQAADFDDPNGVVNVFAEDTGDVTGRRIVVSLRLVEPEEEAVRWLVKRPGEPEVFEVSAGIARQLLPAPEDLLAAEDED